MAGNIPTAHGLQWLKMTEVWPTETNPSLELSLIQVSYENL